MIDLQKRLFIPVIGYILIFYKRLSPKNLTIFIVNTSVFWLTLLFPMALFYFHWFPGIHVVISKTILIYSNVLYSGLLFLLLPIFVFFESAVVNSGKYNNKGWFRILGWNTLGGLSETEVRNRFILFNYHEIMFGVLGLLLATTILVLI